MRIITIISNINTKFAIENRQVLQQSNHRYQPEAPMLKNITITFPDYLQKTFSS